MMDHKNLSTDHLINVVSGLGHTEGEMGTRQALLKFHHMKQLLSNRPCRKTSSIFFNFWWNTRQVTSGQSLAPLAVHPRVVPVSRDYR